MEKTMTYCTFQVAHLLFGVEVRHVQEVLRHQRTTTVPLAQNMVHGLMNLRGQIVTALDLRKHLSLFHARIDPDRLPMNIVLRTADGPISLLVDEIGDVIEVSSDEFETTPDTLPGVIRNAVQGVYKLNGRLMLVLNPDCLDARNDLSTGLHWAG
ncbi:chemotaxis protein CheW [Planctomicrobium sp. SH668]|uniref:chemotaxis protein CheW n=1 Tax=Planctomicrobium sp. SH668 TaxID=3448126 RepID=UPI003F5B561A